VATLVGLLSLLRPLPRLRIPSRRRAAGVAAVGALLVLGAALLPATESHAPRAGSRLDEVLPRWQFAERHETRVRAPPRRVAAAVRDVTADEIRLFRFLTWLRNPRRSWRQEPASLLAPPAERPILEVALGSGFLMLAEDPGSELVVGTLVLVPPAVATLPPAERHRLAAAFTPARFRELSAPGYAKAVMGFRWRDDGDGSTHLVTETRIFATDDAARRRFASYWRVIYPGSALIRRTWLQAIRRRAEASSQSPADATAPPPSPASSPPARTP
jgi:hypothetical protein